MFCAGLFLFKGITTMTNHFKKVFKLDFAVDNNDRIGSTLLLDRWVDQGATPGSDQRLSIRLRQSSFIPVSDLTARQRNQL